MKLRRTAQALAVSVASIAVISFGAPAHADTAWERIAPGAGTHDTAWE